MNREYGLKFVGGPYDGMEMRAEMPNRPVRFDMPTCECKMEESTTYHHPVHVYDGDKSDDSDVILTYAGMIDGKLDVGVYRAV